MLLKVNSIGSFATGTRNKYFCYAERPDQRGEILHCTGSGVIETALAKAHFEFAPRSEAPRFMNRDNELGTIQPGKLADLVLLDANPLDDIANTRKIAAVVFGGRLFPKSSLDEMLAKVEALASSKAVSDILFETFAQKGADAAIQKYRELKSAHSIGMDFTEDDLNTLGYELLVPERNKDAIKILKVNVEPYPQSAKVYASLGEAYMEDGDKKLAIRNFEKSLKLDAKNRDAIDIMQQLQAQ
jgi:tetratricopeptide (TPR) repeat protein